MSKQSLAILLVLIFTIGALGAQEKTIITVMDFSRDGVSESEMKTLISLLSSALFKTKKFTVIDVGERERLLKEMEFSGTGCSDESCQLQIGRMLSAGAIIVGNIGKLGNRYVLSTKMLETETARTINTADGIYPDLDGLLDDIFNMANKLALTHEEAETGKDKTIVKDTAKEPKKDDKKTTPKNEDKKTKPVKDDKINVNDNEKNNQKTGNNSSYFSLTIGAGVGIPFGELSEVYNVVNPRSLETFSYNLAVGFGTLSLGAATGVFLQLTQDEVPNQFKVIAFPLALKVRYTFNFLSPFLLSVDALGGGYLNWIIHDNPDAYYENRLVLKPFAGAGVGLGYRLNEKLNIGLSTLFTLIFYDNAFYKGLDTELYAEFKL